MAAQVLQSAPTASAAATSTYISMTASMGVHSQTIKLYGKPTHQIPDAHVGPYPADSELHSEIARSLHLAELICGRCNRLSSIAHRPSPCYNSGVMDEHSLKVLEYRKVLERLAAHTSNSMGRAAALALTPGLG